VTPLGRLRAALGRDDASLLARARRDVRMGLGLNPPACLAPLDRAIAALERLPVSPEVSLLLARVLRAKAQIAPAKSARVLRARAVAKLRAQIDGSRGTVQERAEIWAALAQAWMPLPVDADDPDLCYRQLIRAREAQTEALVSGTAASHLGMAEIAFALCRHPYCPDAQTAAEEVLHHSAAARLCHAEADESSTADALEAAVRRLFPGLPDASDRKG
jgi:hypothetical protein